MDNKQKKFEQEEDLFGRLFEEAENGKEVDNESATDYESDVEQTDFGAETEGTEEAVGEEETAEESEEITQPQEKETTVGKKEKKDEGSTEPEESDDPEVVRQRYKTLQGMWRSEKEKRAELERRLTELEAKASGAAENTTNIQHQEKQSGAKDEGLARHLTESEEEMVAKILEEDEKFQEIREDFPEVAEALEHSLKKTLSQFSAKQSQQLMSVLQQSLAPLLQSQQQQILEEHYKRVKEAHPDFERYLESGELEAWIKEQPSRKQKYLLEVYNEGSTEEVIDLFNEFKGSMGYSKPTQKTADSSKLWDMEEPKSRTRPISATTKPSARADDYETAFEEAIKQFK